MTNDSNGESRTVSRARRWVSAAVVAGAIATLTTANGRLQAQTEPAGLATLPLARAEAYIEAASNRLDYVPGEVSLKFRDGVDGQGQQRALLALRSRPPSSDLRAVGDVFKLIDRANATPGSSLRSSRASPKSNTPSRTISIRCTPFPPMPASLGSGT